MQLRNKDGKQRGSQVPGARRSRNMDKRDRKYINIGTYSCICFYGHPQEHVYVLVDRKGVLTCVYFKDGFVHVA